MNEQQTSKDLVSALRSVETRGESTIWTAAADEIERLTALHCTLQRIMARLAELLDEDHFAEIEGIVTRAGVTPPPEAWQPIETAPSTSGATDDAEQAAQGSRQVD